jgi:hypothetical protein
MKPTRSPDIVSLAIKLRESNTHRETYTCAGGKNSSGLMLQQRVIGSWLRKTSL